MLVFYQNISYTGCPRMELFFKYLTEVPKINKFISKYCKFLIKRYFVIDEEGAKKEECSLSKF